MAGGEFLCPAPPSLEKASAGDKDTIWEEGYPNKDIHILWYFSPDDGAIFKLQRYYFPFDGDKQYAIVMVYT